MKLTLREAMWSRDELAVTNNNPIMYEVQGWPGSDAVGIYGTTTAEGMIWEIRRNGRATEGDYNSPQEALAALESQ
jgi:hypothetical protein